MIYSFFNFLKYEIQFRDGNKINISKFVVQINEIL